MISEWIWATPLTAWLPTIHRCAMLILFSLPSSTNDIRRRRSSSPGQRAFTCCKITMKTTNSTPSLSQQSDNHWSSLASCCSCNHLEHFSCPCPVITFYLNLSPASEDILVSTVIFRDHHLTLLTMLSWTLKWLLKMPDWLTDIQSSVTKFCPITMFWWCLSGYNYFGVTEVRPESRSEKSELLEETIPATQNSIEALKA